MEINESIRYWIDLAEYDLETAKAMLSSSRYLYVGFMCHQVIEKIFKGYFVFLKNEIPPYSHNLMRIAQNGGFYSQFSDEQKDFIDYLEPLNIEARYPTYKEQLMKSLNDVRCEAILKQTEEIFLWIKTKL